MAYIDYEYYSGEFNGTVIPENEFNHIAEAASLIIDDISVLSVPIVDGTVSENVKKAVAFQAEMIYMQGGILAYTGGSIYETASHETLADYSVIKVGGNDMINGTATQMQNGVPISPLVEPLLRKDGLMNRWAYG